MDINLGPYLLQRDHLRRICRDARPIVESLGLSVVIERLTVSGADLLDDIDKKLSERTFRVLVAGEFNAGKSFFINTMLDGWKREADPVSGKVKWNGLLGVDIVPATTLLTELRFGAYESAQIELRNGHSIALTTAEVPAFTDLARFGHGSTAHIRNARVFESLAQRLNLPLSELSTAGPEAATTISEWLYEVFDRAVVHINSGLLKDGVVIVDSPGLGAVFQEHEKITEAEMRRADAVVFLIASTNPLTERAVSFLQTARAFVDNFFFVQTKTDQLASADVDRVKHRNCSILGELLGVPESNLRYGLVSAFRYRAARAADEHDGMIDSGFPALVSTLSTFLADHRGAATLRLEGEVILRIVEQAERHCLDAMNLGRATVAELDEQAAHAADERTELNLTRRKTSAIIEDSCTRVILDIAGRLKTLRDLFRVNVDIMRGTGGIRSLIPFGSTNIDVELATALRGAAYQVAEDTIHADVVAAAERAIGEIRALGFKAAPLLLSLRFSLPAATLETGYFEKLQNRHIERYHGFAELYFRTISASLEMQIRSYFQDLDRSLGDRMETHDAELALREATINRFRQGQRALFEEERSRLSSFADELSRLRSNLPVV